MAEAIYTLPSAAATPPVVDPSTEGTYVRSTDHAERMVNRLITIFRQPRNSAWLRQVDGPQIQEIEDTIWDLHEAFDLTTAEGAALDYLGTLVGEGRDDLSDALYRATVRARILANHTDGTTERFNEILELLEPTIVSEARDTPPAAVLFRWSGGIGSTYSAKKVFGFMRDAKPAGVQIQAVLNPGSLGFRWSTVADAGDPTTRAFSTVAGGDGGLLQVVLG